MLLGVYGLIEGLALTDLRQSFDDLLLGLGDGRARLVRAVRKAPPKGLTEISTGPRGEGGRGGGGLIGFLIEKVSNPVLELAKRPGLQLVVVVLAVRSHRHEAVLAQFLQVLGDGRLAEAELLNELGDTELASRGAAHARLVQRGQEVASSLVREHIKDVGHGNRLPMGREEYHDKLFDREGSMRTKPVRRVGILGRLRELIDTFASSTPARFAIIIFFGLVVLFTILFSLPISTSSGQIPPLEDSLFTAVSVICVTGLSTVDMATYWSGFGHVLILIGVQIGGIGVLTLASILGLAISRKLGLKAKLMAASDSNPLRLHKGSIAEHQGVKLGEIGALLATVATSALIIEGVIAALLLPRILLEGKALGDAIWQSIYFSVMAFTNTGFLPTAEGLEPYLTDYWFLGVIMVGVFLGAVGFPVIYALMRNLRRPKRWSVHVKLTLTTTVLLFVLGGLAFLILEFNNPDTFAGLDGGQRVFQPFFLSMMTRSGGFSTIDISDLNGSSLLVADMLMFIGGGSASTAGGIKVTTLAILFLAAFAEARGNEEMEAFDRRIPSDVLRLGVSVVLWGATTVAGASIIILQLTGASLDFVLFEVISAFATSGLSTGLTADLPPAGVYVLAATMFFGRVGTVTLAAALAASQRRQLFRRAEERPIVG